MNALTSFLAWVQKDSTLASGRNLVSYALGIVTALGVLTATQAHDLIQAWGDIQSGLAQIAKGSSIIIGILGPIAMAWWARQSTTPAAQKAKVASLPNTIVVETDKTAATADKIATLSEVKTVLSTPEIAKATASDKVVAP